MLPSVGSKVLLEHVDIAERRRCNERDGRRVGHQGLGCATEVFLSMRDGFTWMRQGHRRWGRGRIHQPSVQ